MTVRWGVLGTGGIVRGMTAAIRAEGGEVVGVGSADADRSAALAAELGIARAFAPHHELLGLAADLDAVYVATTNDRHHADALACIRAGIPVLVEKPFALDLAQAEDIVAAARAAGVFAMEAMWMRFQPVFAELERLVAAGRIGEPRLAHVDFGVLLEPAPARRWFARELGGGALLDVGVYALAFVTSVLGPPTAARALGELTATGVDASVSVALRHEGGGLSSWSCSMVADTGVEATVGGSEGHVRVHGPFHEGPALSLRRGTEVLEEHRAEDVRAGYRRQVAEVHRCLAAGARESSRMPLDLTLTVARWLEEIRHQIGLRFPHEDGGPAGG